MKTDFNSGWRYGHLGETARAEVELPHDAMLRERRGADCPGGKNTGWFEGHDYVYEKRFSVPEEWREREIYFEFEGVYRNAKVYLNGTLAAQRAYGYSGFYFRANEFLRFGEENEIRVEAFNADQPNSRWYTGAGIYRPVWLHVLPKRHISPYGVKVKAVSFDPPAVRVEVKSNGEGDVRVEIADGERILARTDGRSDGLFRTEFSLPDAQLWSLEDPKLYECRVTYGEDVRSVPFGIRIVECSAEKGFRINGERVILRGACVHHDNGLLGACAYDFAEERKVRLLKEAGYNAVRSSHNPCSKAFLRACDRLGMLVLDEFTDMWYIHKLKYDYANYFEAEWQRDLYSMVEKDYNHPSVVMYSIGNEVAETAQKRGIGLTRDMTEFLHALDDRPVTCGVNIFFNLLSSLGMGIFTDEKAAKSDRVSVQKKPKKPRKEKAVGSEFFNKLAGLYGAASMKLGAMLPGCGLKTKDAFAALDVAGYNYGCWRYKGDLRRYPHRVILGSETYCADARSFWVLAQRAPALIGDFVWTGIDYLGEVGLGAWEYADYIPDFKPDVGWLCAASGRLDITGRLWGEVAYTRVAFGLDPVRVAAVRPDRAFEKHSASAWRMSNALESWSWTGCEEKQTRVEVYATGKRVALYLNGRCVGRKKVPASARVHFKVKYEPGELVAVSYAKDGSELGRAGLHSGKEGARLTLLPEKAALAPGDLCYVRLQYTDEQGQLLPLARGEISVEAEGGTLIGLGSACPYNERGFLSDKTDTYYGEALAIVKPSGGEGVTLRARSPFGEAQVRIPCLRSTD